MNGTCFPVSNTLAEMKSKGGYLSPTGGLNLAKAYVRSSEVVVGESSVYTVTHDNSNETKTQTVSCVTPMTQIDTNYNVPLTEDIAETPLGEIDVYYSSGSGWPYRCTRSGNTVTLTRQSDTKTGVEKFKELFS